MREHTQPTGGYPTGSCPMSPLELGGVVDEELVIYGVDGLRVVDVSMMNIKYGADIA